MALPSAKDWKIFQEMQDQAWDYLEELESDETKEHLNEQGLVKLEQDIQEARAKWHAFQSVHEVIEPMQKREMIRDLLTNANQQSAKTRDTFKRCDIYMDPRTKINDLTKGVAERLFLCWYRDEKHYSKPVANLVLKVVNDWLFVDLGKSYTEGVKMWQALAGSIPEKGKYQVRSLRLGSLKDAMDKMFQRFRQCFNSFPLVIKAFQVNDQSLQTNIQLCELMLQDIVNNIAGEMKAKAEPTTYAGGPYPLWDMDTPAWKHGALEEKFKYWKIVDQGETLATRKAGDVVEAEDDEVEEETTEDAGLAEMKQLLEWVMNSKVPEECVQSKEYLELRAAIEQFQFGAILAPKVVGASRRRPGL
ncbi:hypothetical protein LTR15_008619 [Elasticomyces elasticus]|nr:hypothetical protein LTR15_008619 [Elasticomyces elasticus]